MAFSQGQHVISSMSLHTIAAETGSAETGSAGFASPLSKPPNVRSVMDPTMDLYEGNYHDPVYEAKARILNRAIQDIGMGRYQVSVNLNMP